MRIGMILAVTGVLIFPVLFPGLARDEFDEHRPISTSPVSTNAEPVISTVAPLPACVTLTGIANLDHKCALLMIRPGGASPFSVVLREGETKASVRVVQINTTNARVVIENAGKVETLSLTGIAVTVVPGPDADHRPVTTLYLPEDGER